MLTIVARLIGFPSADWLVKVFAGRQFRCEVYFPLRWVGVRGAFQSMGFLGPLGSDGFRGDLRAVF